MCICIDTQTCSLFFICYLYGKPPIMIILSNMLWYVNNYIYSNLP